VDERDISGLVARHYGFTLGTSACAKLAKYVELLREWAGRVRLVSRGDRDHVWERHILDCLAIVPQIPTTGHMLDLGSGAGLPGIPMAIARPEAQVDLLEPARMKALFLAEAVSVLGLSNGRVVRDRAENLHACSEYSGQIQVVTARAVATLPRLWSYGGPLLAPHGRLVAMKGPDPLAEFGQGLPLGMHCEVTEVSLPVTGRCRSLVTLREKQSCSSQE
jgi:16S rRNA (guanine527-N7)-methyltransferase